MATSDSLPGWLGSNRVIAGSTLGLLGVVVALTTGAAGHWWPVVVGGLYGIGALLAPGDRSAPPAEGLDEQLARAARLHRSLDRLSDQVRAEGPRLPFEVRERYEAIAAGLGDLLQRAERLATAPEHLEVVDSMVNQYLPTALRSYAHLPESFRTSSRQASGRTPHAELMAQLEVLDSEIDRVARAVFAGDTQALRRQTAMLEERFAESSWDVQARG